jgi:DNA-binding NarL/FixJ family response regulator
MIEPCDPSVRDRPDIPALNELPLTTRTRNCVLSAGGVLNLLNDIRAGRPIFMLGPVSQDEFIRAVEAVQQGQVFPPPDIDKLRDLGDAWRKLTAERRKLMRQMAANPTVETQTLIDQLTAAIKENRQRRKDIYGKAPFSPLEMAGRRW